MNYRVINGQVHSIGSINQADTLENKISQLKRQQVKETSKGFSEVLKEAKAQDERKFKISKHAGERLKKANFTDEDMKNIEKGFEIAKDKNSKNTVMFYKDVALIASVENRTLITAVDKNRTSENIFTNIDSVVLL